MICILDREVKSWRESNYISMDFQKLEIPEIMKKATNIFVACCEKAGLHCPTIKVDPKNTKITLKYDCDDRYVTFTITNKLMNNKKIEYTFGCLNYTPITDMLRDIKQLELFNTFVYGEPKKNES